MKVRMNFSKRKSINVDNTHGTQIEDFPIQPETRYKSYCNQCDFTFYTDSLPESKQKCISHEDEFPHFTNIEFLKGVCTF